MKSYLNMTGFNNPRPNMSLPNGLQNRYGNGLNVNGGFGLGNTGSGGFKDPTVQGKQWWQEGGSGDAGYGQGNIYDNPYSKDAIFRLLQTMYGGAAQDAAWMSGWSAPRFRQGIEEAYNQITPMGAASRYRNYKTAAENDATASGDAEAARLRSLGFSPAAQAGAMTNATNQARESANSYWQKIADPLEMQKQKLGILGMASESPSMNFVYKLLGIQPEPDKGGMGIFDTLMGLGGTAAGLGWNPFGRKG